MEKGNTGISFTLGESICHILSSLPQPNGASQLALVAKNPPANAGDAADTGLISWRRKGQPTPVFLLGKIPWTEELGGLRSMESEMQTRLSDSARMAK